MQTLKVWDVATGRLELTLRCGQNRIYCAAFSPDGKRIASSGQETITIWDANSGHLLLTIPAHDDSIYSVSFSCDGRHVFSASADGAMKLWPAAGG